MATIKATLTHPTKRADGSNFPVAELKHVLLEMRAEAATTWSAVGAPMLPAELSRDVQNIPGGAYRLRATWVDTQDRPSPPSEAPIAIPFSAPNAGTLTLSIV
jgi:hypothetical protein